MESRDPFLVDYKKNLQEVLKEMGTVGSSAFRLLMVEMVRSRWIRDRRATYPYEAAWVFDRREKAVSKLFKELEESGDIELVGLARGKKDNVKPYKPGTLRKPKGPMGPKVKGRSRN